MVWSSLNDKFEMKMTKHYGYCYGVSPGVLCGSHQCHPQLHKLLPFGASLCSQICAADSCAACHAAALGIIFSSFFGAIMWQVLELLF